LSPSIFFGGFTLRIIRSATGQRPDAAIECLRKALRVAPNYADAMFNLALLRQRKNQYVDAADYWRRYLAHDGHSEWATRARRCLKFCEMQGYLIASA
jgi:tetratricopeptide (TPR) repeat protein